MTIMLITGLIALALVIAASVALRSRPADLVAVLFVLGVTGIAVAVSWDQVEQYRAQKAAATEFNQRAAANTVTTPTPDHPRAGS